MGKISFCLEADLKVEQAVGMGNGILLTWNYNPNMTCDYVIKWCNSSRSEPCLMDWKKVPSNSTETVIESGKCLLEFFKDTSKFTFYQDNIGLYRHVSFTCTPLCFYSCLHHSILTIKKYISNKSNTWSDWLQLSDCSPSPLGWVWVGLSFLEGGLWQYLCKAIHRL